MKNAVLLNPMRNAKRRGRKRKSSARQRAYRAHVKRVVKAGGSFKSAGKSWKKGRRAANPLAVRNPKMTRKRKKSIKRAVARGPKRYSGMGTAWSKAYRSGVAAWNPMRNAPKRRKKRRSNRVSMNPVAVGGIAREVISLKGLKAAAPIVGGAFLGVAVPLALSQKIAALRTMRGNKRALALTGVAAGTGIVAGTVVGLATKNVKAGAATFAASLGGWLAYNFTHAILMKVGLLPKVALAPGEVAGLGQDGDVDAAISRGIEQAFAGNMGQAPAIETAIRQAEKELALGQIISPEDVSEAQRLGQIVSPEDIMEAPELGAVSEFGLGMRGRAY